jgi:asparagine synthase (glutamine-hydrolysing)
LDATLLDGESLMYGFLDLRSVRRLLDDHRTGQADNHKLLFSLVVLEQWLRANDHSPSTAVH